MPVDLQSSATLGDLIVRLAERVGLADQSGAVAALPTDADVLARCTRCVNEGMDRFFRANPDWTFLNFDLVLTMDQTGAGAMNIDGDAARYRLPSYITAQPSTDWRYIDSRVRRRNILRVNPQVIDNHRQSRTLLTGPPHVSAVRYRENGAKPGQTPAGWEAIFWPTPDSNYVCQATFRVFRHKMVDLTERHIAGGQHDAAIIAYAAWVWFEDDAEDLAVAARYAAGAMAALEDSKALDQNAHPDSVGKLEDPSIYQMNARQYYLPRVATQNGMPVSYDGV